MQASTTDFRSIIQGDKQYLVPLFQRSYSWEQPQWDTLWQDLCNLYDSDESHPSPHFMGSLVTMETPSPLQGIRQLILIDGQQRLTTILILLCVLRDKAQEKQPELFERINNSYLFNPYAKELDRYKLLPTQFDREIFEQLLTPSEDTKQQPASKLIKCYRFFERKLRSDNLDLTKLVDLIGSHLCLVSIILSSDDHPHLVFESLNAKGSPLTQADLIRNYLLMKIPVKDQEFSYNQHWIPMAENLDNGEILTEFIRHYLSKDGKLINKKDVYSEIKRKVTQKEKDSLSMLQDLCQFSSYYSKFIDPQREEKPLIRKYLSRLNQLDVATVYPFLLNCYHDLVEKKIIENEFIDILKTLENFLLRRFVCDIPTQGLNRSFCILYSQVSELEKDEPFLNKLQIVLQNTTYQYPNDEDFRESLKEVQLYKGNRSQKAKLILESIEESFGHKEQIDLKNLEIEHIMPQSLTNWWKDHLGKDVEDIHELMIHSLGNLTLTAYNPELSNHDFFRKKEELTKSKLDLNKYFEKQDSWTKEDIEKRTEYLVEKVLEIWSYFGDSSKNSNKKSKSTKSKSISPRKLILFQEEYPVKSWRDVLIITLNKIIELKQESFEDIVEEYPNYFSSTADKLRSTRQLENGLFVEINFNRDKIKYLCQNAMEIVGLSFDQWQLETS